MFKHKHKHKQKHKHKFKDKCKCKCKTLFSKYSTLEKILIGFGVILIILAFALLISITFNSAFFDTSLIIDPPKAGNLGSFIGGYVGIFISIASTVFLLITLNNQIKTSSISHIENNFIKMVEFHRANVDKFFLHSDIGKIEGQKVFKYMLRQLKEIYEIVKKNYCSEDERDRLDIAYILFYYGLEDDSIDTIKELLSKYDENNINKIISEIKNSYAISYSDYNLKLSDSNQEILGHYYRNLFGAVKYIDSKDNLDFDEKYQYIKLLRAQLSNQEQLLLFMNVISSMGKAWMDNKYISTYEMIKNIPENNYLKVDLKKYFKNIIFEFELIK